MTRSAKVQWVAVLTALFVALVPASAALAHAALIRSDPAAGAVLTEAPTEVQLTFSEAVNALDDSVRILDAAGDEVAITTIDQRAGAATVTAAFDALPRGGYVIAWKVVSADSHPIAGAFTISVGQATPIDPAVVAAAQAADGDDHAAALRLGVGRAASYAGVALIIGAAVMIARCPTLVDRRRCQRLLIGASVLGAAGTVVMVVAQAQLTTGRAAAWADVIETRAGRWWLIRLALFVAAIGASLAGRWLWRRRHVALSAAGALFAVALAAVVALGGHAAGGDQRALALWATVVHLVAMSVWAGGLATMLLACAPAAWWQAASRFSPLALGAVGALAASGVFAAWRQSDSWDQLAASGYGHWLLVKLCVVVVVVALAAGSRWLLRTRPLGSAVNAAAALRRTVTAEALGIAVIIAVTAGLVDEPPPRAAATTTVAPSTSTPVGPTAQAVDGDRRLSLRFSAARAAATTLELTFSDTATATEEPTEVRVTATLDDRDVGPIELTATRPRAGRSTVDVALPLPGVWTFTISARYSEFEQSTFRASVTLD